VLLFGNARNFPNPGTRATLGLVGEAHLSTLFLDELGEISHEMQARLLRLLDEGGEYIRMGVPGLQHADLRVVAATNRRLDELKFDLVPRLKLRIEVPPLEARREDIPLLLRHILLDLARNNSRIAGKFVDEFGGREEPRVDGFFVDCLVRKSHPLNVRGLDLALWKAFDENKDGDILLATEAMMEEAARDGASRASPGGGLQEKEAAPSSAPGSGGETPGPQGLTKEKVVAALERNWGRLDPTASDLGLSSRYALKRLMAKLGVKRRGK
jgi:DNA-binding NtrC family response regulator